MWDQKKKYRQRQSRNRFEGSRGTERAGQVRPGQAQPSSPRHATPHIHTCSVRVHLLVVAGDVEPPLVARVLGLADADATGERLEAAVPPALLLLEGALDAPPRVVDGGLAADEDGRVVQEGAEEGAGHGPAPRAPEPVRRAEGRRGAVAQGEEGEAGAEVAGWVH